MRAVLSTRKGGCLTNPELERFRLAGTIYAWRFDSSIVGADKTLMTPHFAEVLEEFRCYNFSQPRVAADPVDTNQQHRRERQRPPLVKAIMLIAERWDGFRTRLAH